MNYKNKELFDLLKFVAPGTEIRSGIDTILDAGTGGLIILGCTEEILNICDGGFYINTKYNPQRIYELAKMDGAIILNNDVNEIIYASVQLQPDSNIPTIESGTRHRTAERVAKQTGNKVVAISQRRKRVTIYKGNLKYTLRNISEIITEANQAIKTLERFSDVIDKALANLTVMEFEDLVTLFEVTTILQKFVLILKVTEEIEKYIVELGVEGRLLEIQFEEIIIDLKKEIEALIKDYYNSDKDGFDLENIFNKFRDLSEKEEIEIEDIAFILGYKKRYETLDQKVIPKGFRLLSRVKRLTNKDISKLTSSFDGLTAILDASEDELADENITKIKARSIKNEIKRLKITIEFEKN